MTTIREMLGDDSDAESILSFDLAPIQDALVDLSDTQATDIAHAEFLQKRCLFAADSLCEYIGRLVKLISYLDNKINSTRNRSALNYKTPDGTKVTADMRLFASKSADVDDLENILSKAKGAKVLLDRKYEILIKAHHFYKEVASGYKGVMKSTNATSYIESNSDWTKI